MARRSERATRDDDEESLTEAGTPHPASAGEGKDKREPRSPQPTPSYQMDPRLILLESEERGEKRTPRSAPNGGRRHPVLATTAGREANTSELSDRGPTVSYGLKPPVCDGREPAPELSRLHGVLRIY